MNGPAERIRASLLAVFDATQARMELQRAKENLDALEDDDGLDEVEEYKRKVTKWIQRSLGCLNDVTFWFVLKCSNITREPLTALFNKMSKDGPEGVSKGACSSDELPIVKLICIRFPEVKKLFLQLFQKFESWFADTVDFALRTVYHQHHQQHVLSEKELSCLKKIAWSLMMHNYTAFIRRLVQPLSQHLYLCCIFLELCVYVVFVVLIKKGLTFIFNTYHITRLVR